MHTLTPAGPFCLMLGGCGPLGPLPGLHLLESPPAVAGIVQQHRLVGLANRLNRATSECGRLHARLTVAEHEAAQGKEQLQAVHEQSAVLVARHNAVCEDASALRTALAHERGLTAGAQAAMREAQLAAAAAERRLQRARQGGQEVAEAAQVLHFDLEDARAQLAGLQSRMHSLQAECAAAQAFAHQVAAERTVLHTQLASANNEVTLLRSMLGNVKGLQEQQQQAEQQQLSQHQDQELAMLKQELQEAHSREASLQQKLAAVTAAPQSEQQQQQQQQSTHRMPDPGLDSEHPPASSNLQPAPEPASAPAQVQAQVCTGAEPEQQEGQQPKGPGLLKGDMQTSDGTPRMLMTAGGGTLPLQAVHASVHELAQAHARAMTSELQLVMMEKDYAALKGEVASLSAGIHKERGAAQAAQEKAQAAVAQLHKMEVHYMQVLEELDSQLRAERAQRWKMAGQEAQQSCLQAPRQPAFRRSSPTPQMLPCAPQSSPKEPTHDHDDVIDSSRLGGDALQVSGVNEQGDVAGTAGEEGFWACGAGLQEKVR
ncbi:hypothetical protein DUNSADRAFT_10330 [Dunaliella salina]|uniref:Uncharacterized protein n=1 Tax=Dunaliella salina TaxID=3046 RepID=A0ABQ7H4Y9_DUNSA|nr:hypothetical protein DUNSADRAFT_10330 [Dunaliella salina]|eukprot:KAF5841893.1 hypothetical protein DUNSADRAFT_10330 [Dunaliella salina]